MITMILKPQGSQYNTFTSAYMLY